MKIYETAVTINGKSYSFPSGRSNLIWNNYDILKIHYDTFTWRGPQTFTIKLSTERYDQKSYKLISKDNFTWEFDVTLKGLIGSPKE